MAEQSPDPWRLVWRVVTSDEVLVALLLAIAISLTLTAWIPQQPSSQADFARWLSQMQARFGQATSLLRRLGFFHIVSSSGFRALLALLGMCLLLRLAESLDSLIKERQIDEPDENENWEEVLDWTWPELLESLRGRWYRVIKASSFSQVDRWPWGRVFPLIAYLGALILLASLVLSHALAWQMEGLILQEGERGALPGGEGWVMLSEDGEAVDSSRGVIPYVEESGPGVRVSAIGDDQNSLPLTLNPRAEPSEELTIALTEDTYFALPEAELIVRLSPRSEEAYARVDVQIYNSPTGEIIAERVTEKGGQGVLDVADVTLTLVPAPYARLTVTHNPGRWPAAVGLIGIVVGLLGSLMCCNQCFWVREEGDTLEVAGPAPAWLCEEGRGL